MARPPYTNSRARPKDEPSATFKRKLLLFLEFLRDGYIDAARYRAAYGADDRTLQRDLRQLRTVGEIGGFSISTLADGRAKLTGFDGRPRALRGQDERLRQLITEIARALGPPVQQELESISGGSGTASFLQVHAPALVQGSRVAGVYEALREAATSRAGRSRVRFQYRAANGAVSERQVEPYHVVVRAGRYYLIGYDIGRRDWRIFALDAIGETPARAGSANLSREVPPEYLSDDALGFIKGSVSHTVTIELQPNIASAVTSRQWQRGQNVEQLSDGRALLTVHVPTIAEAARWTFGFAPDARIVGPPEAVAQARRFAQALLDQHSQTGAG